MGDLVGLLESWFTWIALHTSISNMFHPIEQKKWRSYLIKSEKVYIREEIVIQERWLFSDSKVYPNIYDLIRFLTSLMQQQIKNSAVTIYIPKFKVSRLWLVYLDNVSYIRFCLLVQKLIKINITWLYLIIILNIKRLKN